MVRFPFSLLHNLNLCISDQVYSLTARRCATQIEARVKIFPLAKACGRVRSALMSPHLRPRLAGLRGLSAMISAEDTLKARKPLLTQ